MRRFGAYHGRCLAIAALAIGSALSVSPALVADPAAVPAGVRHTSESENVFIALIDYSVRSDRVAFVWVSPGQGATEGIVQRRRPQGPWEIAGVVIADDVGRFFYEDRSVRAGDEFAYRLGFLTGGQAEYSLEQWVQVPGRTPFALTGVHPNPSPGELNVTFSLPVQAPARIDVFDLSGRRVQSRAVGVLGAGKHLVRMDGRLEPGVYMIRLQQGTNREMARAAVVR